MSGDNHERDFDVLDNLLVPLATAQPSDRPSYSFVYDDYADIDAYGVELQRYYGAQKAHLHELAHGRTALAIGATSVTYSIEYREYGNYGERAGERRAERAVTRVMSEAKVPMIARLAINAAPIDPSASDAEPILRLYGSLRLFADRIVRWNDRNALQIPLPGSMDERR